MTAFGPKGVIEQRLRAALAGLSAELAGVDPLVRTADSRFGDYQSNVALSLKRRLPGTPREIAERLAAAVDLAGLCEPAEISGPGFLNLRLSRDFKLAQARDSLGRARLDVPEVDQPERVVVDYSSPNVAKDMHVGHLRSTVIGDALARLLEFLGHDVVRQNHLGDWGTQFGMLIEQLVDSGSAGRLEGMSIADLDMLYQEARNRFDADPAFADNARARVVALQSGDVETLATWRALVAASLRHFDVLYRRLGVTLTPEDVRGEGSYNDMLDSVAADLEKAGLAVMSEGALCVFVDGFSGPDGRPTPLIVRKSDGGYGYAATDLAALRYRLQVLRARRLCYVTDARQANHFAMLFATARGAGWVPDGTRLEHVPFGSVLGPDGKPFRTRAGGTVPLGELLNEAEARALEVVSAKNPDLDPEARAEIARTVGIGAIKYADLSSDRVRDYVFSWERMLSLDGNTAPYLQYAYARVRSILRKAGENGAATRLAEGLSDEFSLDDPFEDALLVQCLRIAEAVEAVADTLHPHRMCTYLFDLATAFSAFYEKCPVLNAQEPTRGSRLALCELTARTLALGLNLLGIDVLEKI